jgi:cytidine deaminase
MEGLNYMTDAELMQLAKRARKNAYAPYSGFVVGAALLCSDESVYMGCNVENASYGATMCAERVAMYQAIANGKSSFVKIAVCGGTDLTYTDVVCPPCGICRQVLREFCTDAFRIVLQNGDEIVSYKIGELLPFSFQKNMLEK